MSRQERLEQLIERGFNCLDDGDVDGAEAALDKARRIDRRHPEVIGLEGSIAAVNGDGDASLAAFEQLVARFPDEAMPLINVAQIHLNARNDPAKAVELADRGLELAEDEDALIQGVMIKAEALIALGGAARLTQARETLSELASSVFDDGELALPLAGLWFDAGDPVRGLEHAKRAQAVPELESDALHLIGAIHDAGGDAAARTQAWREVIRLDAELPAPPWTLSADAFDQLAHDALAELTPRARELLGNTPILVEPVPSDELVADGVDPRLLGLFSGAALPDQGSVGGAPELTTIHLFQRNLEASAFDAEDLAEQIRITVLHETAHFFGLGEEELEAIGLD